MANSAPPCLPGFISQSPLAFLLMLLPMTLAALLACAGVSTIPVFVYSQRGIEYAIGAQNYAMEGVNALPENGFAYTAPDNWPDEIHNISLWLLFHFILFLLIAIYLPVLVFLYAMEPSPKIDGFTATHSLKFAIPRTAAIILAGLTIALTAKDAAIWAAGAGVADFKPDVLGYFVIIVGLIFGLLWLYLLLASLRYKPPSSYRSSSSRPHHSSSSRSRSGASGSRSRSHSRR